MFLILLEFDVSSFGLGSSSSAPVVVTEFVDSTSLVVTEFVDTASVESSSSKLHTMSTVSPTRKHIYFSVISYMQRMFSIKTNIYVAIRHSMFFEN